MLGVWGKACVSADHIVKPGQLNSTSFLPFFFFFFLGGGGEGGRRRGGVGGGGGGFGRGSFSDEVVCFT